MASGIHIEGTARHRGARSHAAKPGVAAHAGRGAAARYRVDPGPAEVDPRDAPKEGRRIAREDPPPEARGGGKLHELEARRHPAVDAGDLRAPRVPFQAGVR